MSAPLSCELLNPLPGHSLNGNSPKIFSVPTCSSFPCNMLSFTVILLTSQLQVQQLMTSQIRSRVKYLTPTYNVVALHSHSNFTNNTCTWLFSRGFYFWPPCIHFVVRTVTHSLALLRMNETLQSICLVDRRDTLCSCFDCNYFAHSVVSLPSCPGLAFRIYATQSVNQQKFAQRLRPRNDLLCVDGTLSLTLSKALPTVHGLVDGDA